MLVFDIETNGLFDVLDRVHCIVLVDLETGEYERYNDQREVLNWSSNRKGSIEDGVKRLMKADAICGHYVTGFDVPALQRVFPWFQPEGKVLDTQVMSGVIFSDLKERDFRMDGKRRGNWIPKQLYGSHKLEAWGHRLGEYKDDYSERMKEQGKDPWAEWNIDMEDYCEQDVRVTKDLYEMLQRQNWPDTSLDLEHDVAHIISRQQRRGFAFCEERAIELYGRLSNRRGELERTLKDAVEPWFKQGKEFTPKRDNARYGYKEGCSFTKVSLVEFNPGSDQHIARYLIKNCGWVPTEFTATGLPEVSESVLSGLDFPLVGEIREYKIVKKLLGQLAEGQEAWLKRVAPDGRIYGRVNQNGAVTGRMTHSKPNLAQTPANDAPYGADCRALFVAGYGYVLVGCDADGLELRCLGHYMAKWDDGAYARTVVEGSKSDGTDAHSVNQRAIGLRTRPAAKTWIYAFLYGAGDLKLGSIFWEDMDPDTRPKPTERTLKQLGKSSRARIQSNLPALGALIEAVKEKAAKSGVLTGLDRRRIPVRAQHAALNTLLQSAGAVVMKRALVILDNKLKEKYEPGNEYEFVANVHDEWQMEAKPEVADDVGEAAAAAIREAGEFYGFRCPLAGSYDIGSSWAETH